MPIDTDFAPAPRRLGRNPGPARSSPVVWLVVLATFAAQGCAGRPSPDPPLPLASTDADTSWDTSDLQAARDSAADEAALRALRRLEFRSLAKGAQHIRGVVATLSTERTGDAYGNGGSTRGGASSGADFDIEVESFASRRRVQYYIDYFLGPSRDRFTIWLQRLGRYEGPIRTLFDRYGLPQDLVYLALIESGYSNTAVSRSRAVGMWQFIASTGRRYGLRVDEWVDERRDPYRATDAAARHLWDLKQEFGSWYLAAAAYNGGATRVNRGLNRLLEVDSLSDETFFELSDRRYLRRETRDYVPKLIAATVIAKAPSDYGFDPRNTWQPLVFDEVTVPDQTGLDVLATLADTTPRALVELNPRFYRGTTPPGERAVVRVPRGAGIEVAHRYAALPASERVNYADHVVRRGETLGEIARRYRVTLGDLVAANRGIRPRSLPIGYHLAVPVSMAARAGTARPMPRISLATRRSRRSGPQPPPIDGYHRVRSGESLWLVSRRYGITVAQLRDWNGIPDGDSFLRVGERLRVTPPAQ